MVHLQILLFLLLIAISPRVYAERSSVEVRQIPLHLMIQSKNQDLLGWDKGPLTLVPRKWYAETKPHDYFFERTGPSQFTLHLDQSLHLVFFKDGEPQRITIDQIKAVMPKRQLDLLMDLQIGDLVADRDGSIQEARKFIELMKNPGFTQEMFHQWEKYVPMRVLKVESLLLDFHLEDFLSEKPTRVLEARYQVTTLVPNRFQSSGNFIVSISVKNLEGRLPRDPFLEQYMDAVKDIKSRYQSLVDRGWDRAFQEVSFERRVQNNQRTSDNVYVLPTRRCSRVFSSGPQ